MKVLTHTRNQCQHLDFAQSQEHEANVFIAAVLCMQMSTNQTVCVAEEKMLQILQEHHEVHVALQRSTGTGTLINLPEPLARYVALMIPTTSQLRQCLWPRLFCSYGFQLGKTHMWDHFVPFLMTKGGTAAIWLYSTPEICTACTSFLM